MAHGDGTAATRRFPFRLTGGDPAKPSTFWLARWLVGGSGRNRAAEEHHPWRRVLWLTGVDYFSTTGDRAIYVAQIHGAIAIANTLAYLSEITDPISIFLGLSRRNQMRQAFRYLLLGEGETGLMVYAILVRYGESTPEDDVRPRIHLMCD